MAEKTKERHRVIIDIPESTHRNLKIITALQGVTMQQYIRNLIKSDMQCMQGFTKFLTEEKIK